MIVSIRVKVIEVKKSESTYSSTREYEEDLFDVIVTGQSTKNVEGKIGKLQEAVTHMGWKLK